MKTYKIVYFGSSRGNKASALYEEVISEEEYRQLTDVDMQEHDRMAQEAAEDFFGVSGWVEIVEELNDE